MPWTLPLAFAAMSALFCAGAPRAEEPERSRPNSGTPTPNEPRPFAPFAPFAPVAPEDEADVVKLDKSLDWLRGVEDSAPLRGEDENPDEHRAYDYVLEHAFKMDPAALARHSLRNLPFANLVAPIRQDYRNDLIHVEGRTIRILPFKPTRLLAEADGIKQLYDVWLYPDERANEQNPIHLVVSELPPGVASGSPSIYPIRFDAYYFKLEKYESGEKLPSGRYQKRVAPLFLGKTFALNGEEESPLNFKSVFVPAVVGLIAVVVGAGLAISLHFRRGDRRVRDQLRTTQLRPNPFDDA